ncbi:MAG: DUF58 domain-containing protein [Sulfuricella sp.]|nr:DUF58 domain-containing protein [Sulfuricella sp.]
MKIKAWSFPSWQARYLKPLVLGLLTATAYLAAINRAQTLPWAIASLFSATLITGVAWPHWLVKRLSVTRTGPERASEGDTITFQVVAENQGRLPRFMVELVDRLPFVGAGDGAARPEIQTLGVVAYIPGGGQRRFEISLPCEKRGFYRLGPVGLASSFPLGLAEARQSRNDGVRTLTIYPDVFPIVALPLHGAPSQIHRGAQLLPEGAGAAEFSGLREYRRGDNPRHIHWPTTARRNELMVREFEPLASASLYLALDLSADSNIGQGRHATLEYAVRIAASIAKYACTSRTPVRLAGQGARFLHLPSGTGDPHYRGILDELAVVDADGTSPYAGLLEKIALECLPGETVVAFLAEPESRSLDTLRALTLLRARGAHLFVIDFDRKSFRPSGPVAQRKSGRAGSAVAAGLADLGARHLKIRRGDDLVRLFNP